MMSAKDKKKGSQVPRLRFPEFLNAEEWEAKRLGELFSERQETNFPSLPLLSLTERNGIIPQEQGSRANTASGDKSKYLRVIPGDIAYNTMRMWEGRSALVGLEGIVSPAYTVCIPQKGNSSSFFSYYFKTQILIEKFHRYSQGLVNDTLNLKFKAFEKITVFSPRSFREQQKIADFLSSLDERITAETSKLDRLKDHKKGLLKQLFPAEGETTPELRFPEFRDAGEWEEVPLSKLVSSLDAGVSVNAGDRPATSEEMGILKTSAVTNGVFEPQENKVVLDVVEIGRMRESVRRNTIIISRMNTPALVGANAYVDTNFENIFLPDRLWAAKPKPDTSMRFISFILSSNQGRATLALSAKGSSGSMKNITKSDVLAFLAMIPSLPEQQRIADCLSSLDELITAQTQKIDLLKDHRKGLMQQLFPRIDEVLA